MAEVHREHSYLEGDDLAAFGKQDIAGKCASCRFWEQMDAPTWKPEEGQRMMAAIGLPVWTGSTYAGFCHAGPPILIEAASDDWRHPVTSWDDWCKEHVPARTEMPFAASDNGA